MPRVITPYSPTNSSWITSQGMIPLTTPVIQGLKSSSNTLRLQKIDQGAGAELADELVEAEIEDDQEERHAGQRSGGKRGEPLAEGDLPVWPGRSGPRPSAP